MFKDVGYKLTISLAEYDMNLVKIWELVDTKDVAGTWKQAQVSFKTLDAYKIFIDVTSSGDSKTFIGKSRNVQSHISNNYEGFFQPNGSNFS